MRERSNRQSIPALAALLLVGMFGVSILSVLLTGADTYRRLTRRDQLSYDSRTCAQYVATKVRQAPSPEAVGLGHFGGSDALVIREELDGAVYLTRVYCHNGWLMELFSAADGDFAPEDGEKILPADSLMLIQTGALLQAEIAHGEETTQTALYLRGGEEGAA